MSIWLAFGMPGTGKSTLLHDLVGAHAQTHRLFVQDNEAQWGPDGLHWRGRPPKDIRVVEGEEAANEVGKEALLWEEPLPESGIWVFRNVSPERVVGLAVDIGNVTYVNDEVDRIGRTQGWLDSPLRKVVHEGRHLENAQGEHCQVNLIGACRRPANLHTDLTELADQVYLFRLRGLNTRKRLFGDALIHSKEEWNVLTRLPNFHCKHVEVTANRETWRKLAPVKPPV